MQKKTRILFPLFFVLTLISSLFLVNNTNALIYSHYYNWIDNPSFLAMSNYIEDASFESGLFKQGLVYGNWSVDGLGEKGVFIQDEDYAHSGIYSMKLYATENETVQYLFYGDYNNTLGEDIEDFYFFARSSTGAEIRITVYYSDETNDYDDYVFAVSDTYVKIDLLDMGFISSIKYVNRVLFDYNSVGGLWMDDVCFIVDDGGGQDEIYAQSSPWYESGLGIWSYTPPTGLHILNSTFGRLDNSSCGISQTEIYIAQDIDYLDSDYVHYVDGYFYSDYGSELSVKCRIGYSDGTSSEKTETIDADSTWEYINFGKSFIQGNKYIYEIQFMVGVDIGGEFGLYPNFIWVDDVGLWASVEYGWKRFAFSIMPYPIEKGSYSFSAYQQVQYTMNCYLYNATGSLDENGTYQFSDNTGFTTGDFELGVFSYVLTARGSTQNFAEYITVTVILTEEVLNFEVRALWMFTGAEEEEAEETAQRTSDFMFLFIFIFLPSIFLAGITYRVGMPMIGFISGLTIMTSIGKLSGIVPLWFLFVMVLVVALLVLAMLKSGGLR